MNNKNITLLVDGDNLLTIGFYGCKNFFYKGTHIGGIYHFINTLRKMFESYNLNKIVVFWDGENGSISRKKIYHKYKENRKVREKTQEEIDSYNYQRNRIKKYLEEIYVRQGEFEFCETDDCIGYYVKININENIIIYSSDGDLTQLVRNNVRIYNPSHQKIYKENDFYEYKKNNILIENVKIIKIMCGDDSDNISGIKNLGIKRLITLFPEIITKKLNINDIKQKSEQLFNENKDNNILKNILSGLTKEGILGEEFFNMNTKIIDLNDPLLTDYAKETIHQLYNDSIDTEGRSYKNVMKLMMEDGFFNLLPKSDDSIIKFLTPFLRLTRIEKNKKTIKIYEH